MLEVVHASLDDRSNDSSCACAVESADSKVDDRRALRCGESEELREITIERHHNSTIEARSFEDLGVSESLKTEIREMDRIKAGLREIGSRSSRYAHVE